MESEWEWLIFWRWLPLVVRGRRYGSLLCNRALPLRAAPDARKQLTPGSPTGSGGRFLRMRSVKLLSECGVKDISSVDPGSLLRTESLPIDQIQKGTAPASGIQQLVHSIRLLAVNQERQGGLGSGSLLRLSSRTTSGFQKGYMEGGRNTIISRQF